MNKTQEQLSRHDKQISVIRDLVKQGMQLGIATRQDIRALAAAQKRLEASQERTDASLKALIDTLKRSGGNGHSKAKVEIQ